MEILLWTAISVLLFIVAALSLKIFLMKKSVRTAVSYTHLNNLYAKSPYFLSIT